MHTVLFVNNIELQASSRINGIDIPWICDHMTAKQHRLEKVYIQ